MTILPLTRASMARTEPTVRLIASARSWIDAEAIRQLYVAAKLPGVQLAVGYPDLQPGRTAPVGAAFVSNHRIHPHVIGGDIGCGMALFKTSLTRRHVRLDHWAEVRFDLEHPWEGDARARLADAALDTTRYVDAFGTLGESNHFAELQAVENVFDRDAFVRLGLEHDELLALVHSGSRGLGQSVLDAHLETHGTGDLEAESAAGARYLQQHDHAVAWAAANRALLAERFVTPLGGRSSRILDACHNSVLRVGRRELKKAASRNATGGKPSADARMDWLHRKGAAPSDRGAIVIAGTRGTFSYLVEPIGDQTANAWSVAHGAGRKWMRSESRLRVRERFRRDELIQTGLGGRVICDERNLLYEEAPMAYKNIEVVMADLVEAGLVSIIATLRPLLTYRGRKVRRHEG